MLKQSLFATALSAASLCCLLSASGQTRLMLPSNNTLDYDGRALSITNTHVNAGGTGTLPAAIAGIESGAHGTGVLGSTSGSNSNAVSGANTGTGFAGQFVLSGTNANALSAAIRGQNTAGSTAAGNYGNAGLFRNLNIHNQSPAVSISSNGVNSHALYVVNSGGSNGHVTYTHGDEGGVAAWFEITKPSWSSVLFSVNSADTGTRGPYGSAASFIIASTNNTSPAVQVNTDTSLATGLDVVVGGEQAEGVRSYSYGNNATTVDAAELSDAGGRAVFAQSLHGTTAYFQHGTPGVYSHCSYAGGPGWSCSSDRNLKKDFRAAALGDVLDRLARMPVYYYRMKDDTAGVRYLGPTAQDFRAAFQLGDGDTTINTANAQGVALAAAKGLAEKLHEAEARIAGLEQQLAAEHAALVSLQESDSARLAKLEDAVARMPHRTLVREASTAP
ncbi:MAG TPA: tail fiber domain-containing protein [Alphaproteobacteria bacterium]|jgi:hypothetical protein|nr:tail fiber domain-containing protein [Alphaproteobacteria bacterium]